MYKKFLNITLTVFGNNRAKFFVFFSDDRFFDCKILHNTLYIITQERPKIKLKNHYTLWGWLFRVRRAPVDLHKALHHHWLAFPAFELN